MFDYFIGLKYYLELMRFFPDTMQGDLLSCAFVMYANHS